VDDQLGDRPAGTLALGDRVRLIRSVGSLPAGAEAVVVGFFRRDPEVIVVKLADSYRVLEVHPEDVERSDA
jgi:hypothetical protein